LIDHKGIRENDRFIIDRFIIVTAIARNKINRENRSISERG